MSDAKQLAHNYEDIAYGVNKYRPANVIDNGDLSIDETVDMIERLTAT